MKSFSINIILIFAALGCFQVLISQTLPKKKITPNDYSKWSTLTNEKLSPLGSYISYKLEYDLAEDTLFVKNTTSLKELKFPGAISATFNNTDSWVAINQESGLLLKNLDSGTTKHLKFAINGDFFLHGDYFVALVKESESQDLLILNLQTDSEIVIKNIREYTVDANKKSIAYITQSNEVKVFLWDNKLIEKTLLGETDDKRKNLVWSDDSNTLSFLEEMPNRNSTDLNHKIFYIKNVTKNDEVYLLNPLEAHDLASEKIVLYNPYFTPLGIAPDNEKVFFYLKGKPNNASKDGVEIWNSTDKLEYKRNLLEGNPESRPKLTVWWPETNRVLQITDNEHHSVYLSPDGNFAFVFDPHQYEPQDEIMGPYDLWLIDLSTGKRKMILEKQSGKIARWGVSPNSRYLNYYKDKNWWIYDLKTEKHWVLSGKMIDIEDTSLEYGGEAPSYGFAGWSTDNKYLFLNTRFDVWIISIDGKRRKRLSDGQPTKTRFRLCDNLSRDIMIFNSYNLPTLEFELKKDIVIKAFDLNNKASGFYKWRGGDKLVKMIFKNSKLDHIQKALKKQSYIMTEQKSDLSPQIIFLDNSEGEKILVRTNVHQENYEWTRSELINYKSTYSEPLQGVLLYPSGYQSGEKYPMIVYIYEAQSDKLHNYYNPTFYDSVGFSPSNYTSEGYFVLLPDINYKLGNPGYAALDCVNSAMSEVKGSGMVKENNIGLIGFSFGGYETSFIVTQTNNFAAAVAGAGVTDIISNSLSVNLAGRSEMWRYQTYQMRMGKGLYDDYIGYQKNSPIANAEKINTPLLSWSGKNDYSVDPNQSILMNMAMRSLNKQHILLRYPGEGHALSKNEFQKDLTIKIKSWFDHYLKNTPLSIDLN